VATFETEALVLKQFDLGESDRLITLYTREKGKLKKSYRVYCNEHQIKRRP
jgi:recombinational DNA repair protein (RecF pathway)